MNVSNCVASQKTARCSLMALGDRTEIVSHQMENEHAASSSNQLPKRLLRSLSNATRSEPSPLTVTPGSLG
jgi:hypothetical protein